MSKKIKESSKGALPLLMGALSKRDVKLPPNETITQRDEFQEGGMVEAAQAIADKGRNGDSMLVHMAPEEVQGIASLGMVSVNPETGLPEMFKFKDFLKIAVPIALTAMAPAAGTAAMKATAGSTGFLGTAGKFLGSGIGKSLLTGAAQFAGQRLMGTDEKDALNAGIMAGATYGAASAAQKAFGPSPEKTAVMNARRQAETARQQQFINQMSPGQVNLSRPQVFQPDAFGTAGTTAAQRPTGIASVMEQYPELSKNYGLREGMSQAELDATRNYAQAELKAMQAPTDKFRIPGIETRTISDVGPTRPEPLYIDKKDLYSGLGAGAVGAMSVPPEVIEEEKRKRKEIEMAQPYSVSTTFPGAGYGSREYGYFGPNYGLYAKEGGHIKQMQEGGIVDAAPALAPPPSPSELGLGEPPAPVENVGMAAPMPEDIPPPMPEEIQTTTAQDILPSSPPLAFTQNVPASAFQGNLMAFAPGILGGARYGMGAMPAAMPVNTTEFGYDVFNPNIRGYDYRSFVPQDYQSPVGIGSAPSAGAGIGTGEQVTGSPNVIADTKKASGSRSTSTFKPYTKWTSFTKLGEKAYIPGASNRMFRDVVSGYTASGEPIYTRETRYTVPGSSSNWMTPETVKYGTRPIKFQEGGITSLPQTEGQVEGNGDGMSDEVYGDIENQQEVALSKDEFIVPADVVSSLGNGSSDAGADELYRMMERVRMAKSGKKTQPPEIDAEDYLPA